MYVVCAGAHKRRFTWMYGQKIAPRLCLLSRSTSYFHVVVYFLHSRRPWRSYAAAAWMQRSGDVKGRNVRVEKLLENLFQTFSTDYIRIVVLHFRHSRLPWRSFLYSKGRLHVSWQILSTCILAGNAAACMLQKATFSADK